MAPPPLWLDHENFFKATLYEKVHFLLFSNKNCKIQQYLMVFFHTDTIWYDAVIFCISEFQKKMGKFAASIERSKAKSVSASGGLCPLWHPDQGLCPWTPLGAPPPDPHYRLALCALAMPPLCQILNTSLPAFTPVMWAVLNLPTRQGCKHELTLIGQIFMVLHCIISL